MRISRLMARPELSTNKAQFARNVVTIIKPGTKIEIVDTGSYYWKQVLGYNDQGSVYAKGWIQGEIVKKAHRTDKGGFAP